MTPTQAPTLNFTYECVRDAVGYTTCFPCGDVYMFRML